MPRELVVNQWCDPCYAEEQHTPGEEVTLSTEVSRMKPLSMLLCERHRKEVYDPILALLEEYGAPPGADAPTAPKQRQRGPGRPRIPGANEPQTCSECGHQAPNRSALASHVRGQHGMTLAEMNGEPLPHLCEECGRRFGAPQGLVSHQRIAHGIPAPSRRAEADEPLPES